MAKSGSYREIQKWVRKEFGFAVESCWIAHGKELTGLPVSRAHNRQGQGRVKPCPPEKLAAIQAAFRHFGFIA